MQPTALRMTAPPDAPAAPGLCRGATPARHDNPRESAFGNVLAGLNAPTLDSSSPTDTPASDAPVPDAHAVTSESDALTGQDAGRLDIESPESPPHAPPDKSTQSSDTLSQFDPDTPESNLLPGEWQEPPLESRAGPDDDVAGRPDRDGDTPHPRQARPIGIDPTSLPPAAASADPPPNPPLFESRHDGPGIAPGDGSLRAPSPAVVQLSSIVAAESAAPSIRWAASPQALEVSRPDPLADSAWRHAGPIPDTVWPVANRPHADTTVVLAGTPGRPDTPALNAQTVSPLRPLPVADSFSAAPGSAVTASNSQSEGQPNVVTSPPRQTNVTGVPLGQSNPSVTPHLLLRDAMSAVPPRSPDTLPGAQHAADGDDPIQPHRLDASRARVPAHASPTSAGQASSGAQTRIGSPAMASAKDASHVEASPALARAAEPESRHDAVASASSQSIAAAPASGVTARTHIRAPEAPRVVPADESMTRSDPLEEIGSAARQPARKAEAAPLRDTPPPGAPPAPVTRQIIGALRGDPAGRIELWLEPAELGRLRIQMLPGEQGLSVQIAVERPETLDLLRRHAGSLDRALANEGLSLADFAFASGGRDPDPAARSTANAPPAPDIPGDAQRARDPAPRRAGGALDLRM